MVCADTCQKKRAVRVEIHLAVLFPGSLSFLFGGSLLRFEIPIKNRGKHIGCDLGKMSHVFLQFGVS